MKEYRDIFLSPTRVLLHFQVKHSFDLTRGAPLPMGRYIITPMWKFPSTRSDMINIGCHTSFRWVTKSSCICRKNTLQEPIGNSNHSDMVLTPLPTLWETMIWSITFLHSLACTTLDHASHHYWTHQRLQNISPGTRFNRNFLILGRHSMQWGPLLPKVGGTIQVDVGGHSPIPLGHPTPSLSVFRFP